MTNFEILSLIIDIIKLVLLALQIGRPI
jgi:hypothetical protein